MGIGGITQEMAGSAMLVIGLRVSKVEERTRVLRTYKNSDRVLEEKYWAVVLSPGHILIDLGKEEPDVKAGQEAKIIIG